MRADGKPQPPSPKTTEPRRRGRPRYFGPDQYMEVWLYVREWMARKGLSANRVCQLGNVGWVVGGAGGPRDEYVLKSETLRSYYQRAERLLKQEREEYEAFVDALRRLGARSRQEDEPLPLNSYWHGELQRRLALAAA